MEKAYTLNTMKTVLTLLTALLLAPLAALHSADAPKTGAAKRPAFHFTPPQGWMNDPNGLLFHNGEYHLYYQSYPDDIQRVIFSSPAGDAAGARINWGHAVSRDLVGWQHLPLAITEEVGNDRLGAIYSGSAVVDYANRSGLSLDNHPPLVAFYTVMQFARAASVEGWQPTTQPVSMAYSTDSGRTFTKYERNPVVDVNDRKFGDPMVLWHEPSKQWIMVNIWGFKQGKVGFWGSSDLKDWKFLSEFHAEQDGPGKWECPDLFPLAVDSDASNTKWVLKVNGRHGSRKYFIGEFDGREFRRDPALESSLPYDQGKYYAEVTFNGIPDADGRRLILGWIPQKPRLDRDWTGMLSVPRSLALRTTPEGLRVCQEPAAELRVLRGTLLHWQDKAITAAASPASLGLTGSLWELEAELAPDSAEEVGFRIALDSSRELIIGYDRVRQQVFCEQHGGPRSAAAQPMRGETLKLHLLIDHAVIEIFAEGGETAFVALIDSDASVTDIEMFAKGGSARALNLHAWRLDDSGTKVGNTVNQHRQTTTQPSLLP